MLDYDAINLAEKDLQYGHEFLREMREQHNLSFVSANVYETATGKLFAKPHIIKKINGWKVGIFGVTMEERAARMVPPETGFEIRDPVAAAKNQVQTLKQECDLIIGLVHVGINNSIQLVEQVEGIDIIISGHFGTHLRKPHRVGDTVVMQPGSKGKYLGQLDFQLPSDGKSNVYGKTVALNSKISDDAELARLVKEYDEEVLLTFPLESPKAKTQYSLFSQRACITCHFKQHNQWRATLHSHAWETLVEEKQAHNPECQKCHTTMSGEPNGFTRLAETPDLVSVQCAECHRPVAKDMATHINRFRGRGRSTNGETNGATKDFKPITEETCRKCHNEENTPHFDYAEFRAKITH